MSICRNHVEREMTLSNPGDPCPLCDRDRYRAAIQKFCAMYHMSSIQYSGRMRASVAELEAVLTSTEGGSAK